MKILRTIKQVRRASISLKRVNKKIGFVPTMGALHEGHLSLLRRARRENDCVVVSIFVNPAQFGPKEDLSRYPRPLNIDLALCRREGVNFVFIPSVHEIYPKDFSTYVTVEGLNNVLCGSFRPGHFRAVATVVAKLFNIVHPDSAYFGQKDAQQAAVIKRMVRDLNIPVEIKVLPTVREPDGLALSSRNIYLSPDERLKAHSLYGALSLAEDLVRYGESDSKKIITLMTNMIKKLLSCDIDYIEIADPDSLEPLQRINKKALVALAVRIGKTRLIDNTVVDIS